MDSASGMPGSCRDQAAFFVRVINMPASAASKNSIIARKTSKKSIVREAWTYPHRMARQEVHGWQFVEESGCLNKNRIGDNPGDVFVPLTVSG